MKNYNAKNIEERGDKNISIKSLELSQLKKYAPELTQLYNEGFANEPWNDPNISKRCFVNRFTQLVKNNRESFNVILEEDVIIGGFAYGDLSSTNKTCQSVIKFIEKLGQEYTDNDALWFDAFVTKEMRNNGICSQAFDLACNNLRQQNKRRIWLTTLGGEEGKGLQEFWKNRGMKMVSDKTGDSIISPAKRVLLYKDLVTPISYFVQAVESNSVVKTIQGLSDEEKKLGLCF